MPHFDNTITQRAHTGVITMFPASPNAAFSCHAYRTLLNFKMYAFFRKRLHVLVTFISLIVMVLDKALNIIIPDNF